MATVRMTSKRQVTFPRTLCEELNLRPGSRIRLGREVLHGRAVWVLVPDEPDWSFVGAARAYAKGRSHRMEDIRRSIGRMIGKTKGS